MSIWRCYRKCPNNPRGNLCLADVDNPPFCQMANPTDEQSGVLPRKVHALVGDFLRFGDMIEHGNSPPALTSAGRKQQSRRDFVTRGMGRTKSRYADDQRKACLHGGAEWGVFLIVSNDMVTFEGDKR